MSSCGARWVAVLGAAWCACATVPPPVPPATLMRAQIARGELYEACVAASDAVSGDAAVLQELRELVRSRSEIEVGAIAFDGPSLLRGAAPRKPGDGGMAVRAEDMPGTTGFFLGVSVRQRGGLGVLAPVGTPDLVLSDSQDVTELTSLVTSADEKEFTRKTVAKLGGVAASDKPAFSGWDFLGILATGGLLLADDKYRAGLDSRFGERREPTTEAEWRMVDQIGGWWMQRFVALADGYEQRLLVEPESTNRPFALRVVIDLSLAQDARRCRLSTVRLDLPLPPRGATVAGAINAWFPAGPRALRELQAEAGKLVRDPCFFTKGCRDKGLCTPAPDGSCVAGSNADCRRDPECAFHKTCWQADGACGPSPAKRCPGSDTCRLYGMCRTILGFNSEDDCNSVSQRSCRAAEVCREYGLCAADPAEDRCLVGTLAEGRASRGCRLHGDGTPGDWVCQPAREADCRESDDCRMLGWCSYVDHHCVAASDDDCAGSRMCRELGWCHASYDGCYCGPPEPKQVEAWLAP